MNWSAVVIGLSSLVAVQALAVSPTSQAALTRRQLSDCMTKQMAASRTMSYNDASKACKDRIRLQVDGLSTGTEVKPANVR